MKTTRIVLFLMVLSILWCADVFAHPIEGKTVIHFCPGTEDDPCEGTDCEVGSDYDGGHGHVNSYDDTRDGPGKDNGQYDYGEENSWGYWTKGGYAVVRGNADDIGCGDGTPPPLPPPPPPPQQFSIVVISGPGSGAPGDTLTFVVEVRENGAAKPGQTVDFSITSGDANASLNPARATTGTNGQAQTTLTLGSSASGSYIITATSNGESVTGTATVTNDGNPGQITSTFSIVVISGPGSGAPGDTLTFIVEVQEDGTAAPDQAVTFIVDFRIN